MRLPDTNIDTLLAILRALLSARLFVFSHWHRIGNLARTGVPAVRGLYARFKGVGWVLRRLFGCARWRSRGRDAPVSAAGLRRAGLVVRVSGAVTRTISIF